MSEKHLEPIKYKCCECGDIYEQGLVNAENYPVQNGGLCPKCQSTLPKTTVETIRYYGKTQEWTIHNLDCTVCHQAPCRHMEQKKGLQENTPNER